MIGYYGDKRWCLWLIEKMHGGGDFRVCGCTETALMFMANRQEQSWKEWADAHQDEPQEKWIQDGFAQRGISVHFPPHPEDSVPLLEVLGHKSWNTLWGGPQGTKAPDSFPGYFQYNAFRWLRDSGFDQTLFAFSNAPALTSDLVKAGLMQYTKWNAAFPKHEGVGILAFGEAPADTDKFRPPQLMLHFWSHAAPGLFAIVPIVAGAVLYRRRIRVDDRVKRAAYCVTLPFRAAGRWASKHRRTLLVAGLAAGCVCIAITYFMLPAWLPEWTIHHSASPDRVLRAAYFAFNGHFEATPALKKLLGDGFDDFLLRKLAGSDETEKEEAACILAHSDDPAAEEALIETYLKGQTEEMQSSLVFYLGWTATDRSREFLTSILDGRIIGPRWSAIRALSNSSILDRYEIISLYLNDADERVRDQAEHALKYKLEEEFADQIAAMAESELFPLAKRLAQAHRGAVPANDLPSELAGRKIRWGCIQDGCLDLRFDDDKTGLLINPEGMNTFPAINRYLIGGGNTEGISPYTAF